MDVWMYVLVPCHMGCTKHGVLRSSSLVRRDSISPQPRSIHLHKMSECQNVYMYVAVYVVRCPDVPPYSSFSWNLEVP